jgi:hypothetical protein
MNNTNKDLFDKIEGAIDDQNKENALQESKDSIPLEIGFQDELAFRIQVQEKWNKAARFEKVRKDIKELRLKNQSSNSRKLFVFYAAAACLLFMLSISFYNYFISGTGRLLEIDQSEIKSAVTFYDSQYRQISPVNGQFLEDGSILFEWETSLAVKTSLVISNVETGENLIFQPLNSEEKNYRLKKALRKGKYSWRLEGYRGEMIFIIK